MKRGGFRMSFKIVKKTIFLCNYLFLFQMDIIKVYDKKVISFCVVFLIMLHT